MSDTAFKILSADDWDILQTTGGYDGSAVDLRDGYIHLSTADQLAETAAKHYAGRANLRLLGVDLRPYGEAIVWEPSRGGALFPHLYGRLTAASVIEVRAFRVGDAGEMIFEDRA